MIGLLIRHGHCDAVGKWLAGRRDGLSLSATGREDAERLSAALKWLPLTAVYTSPLARAVETAEPLARDHGLPLSVRDALTDIDFGEWTGHTMEELAGDPRWKAFNDDRRHACPPRGEALVAVQQRVVAELSRLARAHGGEIVALVTHAEPIRCAVAALNGYTLDEVKAVDIDAAHVCTVGIDSSVRQVLALNVRPDRLVV